jgi:hypothetical protein
VIVPSVAVTSTEVVPPGVVIRVGTDRAIALFGNELTELGLTLHVTPEGQPAVTERLTVPVYPPIAANERVYVAVLPAATL